MCLGLAGRKVMNLIQQQAARGGDSDSPRRRVAMYCTMVVRNSFLQRSFGNVLNMDAFFLFRCCCFGYALYDSCVKFKQIWTIKVLNKSVETERSVSKFARSLDRWYDHT